MCSHSTTLEASSAEQGGIELLKGDFSDSDSLVKAATGMDTVYAMTTPFETGTEAETKQGIAIADAVKKANVGHFIFGSVASADKNKNIQHFDSKYEVENHIFENCDLKNATFHAYSCFPCTFCLAIYLSSCEINEYLRLLRKLPTCE